MFVIKNGKTEYTILLKANATERVEFAVKELIEFLYEATGCRMQITEQENAKKTITLGVLDKGNEGYHIYSNDEIKNKIIKDYVSTLQGVKSPIKISNDGFSRGVATGNHIGSLDDARKYVEQMFKF